MSDNVQDVPEVPDNVVQFRFKKRSPEDLPTAPVKKAPGQNLPYCGTHLFEYDLDERLVRCTRCTRIFDAFEALEHLANQWRNYDYNHRHVRQEIAEFQQERDRLEKQVKNLKSQRRRLVPNVRQDVDRVRAEIWRYDSEKNAEIRHAIFRTIISRLEKVMHTIETFGDDPEPARTVELPTGGRDG